MMREQLQQKSLAPIEMGPVKIEEATLDNPLFWIFLFVVIVSGLIALYLYCRRSGKKND